MAAIGRRDTSLERRVRSILHAQGFRFRVDLPIRLEGVRPIRPDIVFTRQLIVVFLDGCFWHGCSEHGGRAGGRNEYYWSPKIAGNRERDARHTALLRAAGWRVLRFWEHEPSEEIAEAIAALVRPPSLPAGRRAKPGDSSQHPAPG